MSGQSFDRNLRDEEPCDDNGGWLFSITTEIEGEMNRIPSTSRKNIQIDENRAY
jgi:hypothetical protein